MDLLDTFFNVPVLVRTFPLLLSGLWVTVRIGITSILCGLVLGLVLTVLAALLVLLALHVVGRMPWLETAGAVAGVQTQPAVLAFVNERTGYDTRVGVGYALVYPVAMIVKILVAQVLATLG